MEKISGFLSIFIILFLLYSYIKTKKPKKDIVEKVLIKKEEKEENENYEQHVLSAIIAAVMDGKKYKIRNVFLEKKEKNVSTWKTAGRNYNMQRRDRV
jgi:hypothetical protein